MFTILGPSTSRRRGMRPGAALFALVFVACGAPAPSRRMPAPPPEPERPTLAATPLEGPYERLCEAALRTTYGVEVTPCAPPMGGWTATVELTPTDLVVIRPYEREGDSPAPGTHRVAWP